jgi:hypothetical protein
MVANPFISQDKALRLMREGAYMMMMFTRDGTKDYFIVRKGGGKLKPMDAHKITERPDVFPQGDALFPGIAQSWKMGG